jgi:hypothetical protein
LREQNKIANLEELVEPKGATDMMDDLGVKRALKIGLE